MMTNQGQIEKLKFWIQSSSKFAMLINQPTIDKTDTLSSVRESIHCGEGHYYRTEITPYEWSIPNVNGSSNAVIVSAEKEFGPFTENVPVTHVGVCSLSEGTAGSLYFFAPIEHFIKTGEAKVFKPGEIFAVTIREEQV